MREDLGPRRLRRHRLRRSLALIAGVILFVTAAAVAAVLMWPTESGVPAPIVFGDVATPQYLASFGGDGQDPFVEPVGVTVTGGRVYVADAGRGEIVVHKTDGSRVTAFGKGILRKPVYIAHDPLDGRLYVSDRTVPGIHVFDSRGDFIRTFHPEVSDDATESAETQKPLAVAFTDNGTMYLTDASDRQRVLKIGPTGRLVADAGRFVPEGPAGASVSYANGIAAAGDRVIVADSNNLRLLLFDPDLHFEGEVRFPGLPRGLCAVSWGRAPVFAVADTTGRRVRLVDDDGRELRSFDGASTEQGRFVEPTGLAHDGTSRLYVVDSGARRVCVWRVEGRPKVKPKPEERSDTRQRIALSIAIAGLAAAATALFLRARTGNLYTGLGTDVQG